MRKRITIILAILVASLGMVASIGVSPAQAHDNATMVNVAIHRATANCLRYTGCRSLILVGKEHFSDYTVYTFVFHTTYYGWRCYYVNVSHNGTAWGGVGESNC